MIKLLPAFAAGIIVGILFTPYKGSDTRKKLLKGLNELKDDAEYFLLSAADKVKSKSNDIASSPEPKE